MSRKVLQVENVGPNCNSLYVLRIVQEDAAFVVEIVDVRGTVVWRTKRSLEKNARELANQIYTQARQDNGWSGVR